MPNLLADYHLWESLRLGRYRSAERCMLKGATFVDLPAERLWDQWQHAFKHGTPHLDWMLEHAGQPQDSRVWPSLLAESWLTANHEISDWLLTHRVDVNGATFGDGTPFLFALRGSQATFEWAWANTARTVNRHNPFQVLWSDSYAVCPDLAIASPLRLDWERWERVHDHFLASHDACAALLESSWDAATFIQIWQWIERTPEGQAQAQCHREQARKHPRWAPNFEAWERSLQREHHLQAVLPASPSPRHPRARS